MVTPVTLPVASMVAVPVAVLALEPALAAASKLLAGTVEAVNPGTSRRELLAYVTQYRQRLADLVAACQTVGGRHGV